MWGRVGCLMCVLGFSVLVGCLLFGFGTICFSCCVVLCVGLLEVVWVGEWLC